MQTFHTRVQELYTSLEDLENYDEIYGIVKRCGYENATQLWNDNPMIGGSSNPKDFGIAKIKRGQIFSLVTDEDCLLKIEKVTEDSIIGKTVMDGKKRSYIPATFYSYWKLG